MPKFDAEDLAEEIFENEEYAELVEETRTSLLTLVDEYMEDIELEDEEVTEFRDDVLDRVTQEFKKDIEE